MGFSVYLTLIPETLLFLLLAYRKMCVLPTDIIKIIVDMVYEIRMVQKKRNIHSELYCLGLQKHRPRALKAISYFVYL